MILTDLNDIHIKIKEKNELKLQEQLVAIEKQKAEELKQIQDYNTKAKAFFDLY